MATFLLCVSIQRKSGLVGLNFFLAYLDFKVLPMKEEVPCFSVVSMAPGSIELTKWWLIGVDSTILRPVRLALRTRTLWSCDQLRLCPSYSFRKGNQGGTSHIPSFHLLWSLLQLWSQGCIARFHKAFWLSSIRSWGCRRTNPFHHSGEEWKKMFGKISVVVKTGICGQGGYQTRIYQSLNLLAQTL